MNEITISAKDLAALAMPDACPRCFWIKNTIKKLPWQIFPGIFSSIDSYTKKIVHYVFDTTGKPPVWIPEISEAKRYLKALHYTKFFRQDPDTDIIVRGGVDDIFECEDKSRIIPDYKTAKYTKNQDKLLPLYDGQLNLYAWIEEGFGNTVRPDLPLIYCEPITEPAEDGLEEFGFNMPFKVKTVIVKKNEDTVKELLSEAAEILVGTIPVLQDGCKDCEALENIMKASCTY